MQPTHCLDRERPGRYFVAVFTRPSVGRFELKLAMILMTGAVSLFADVAPSLKTDIETKNALV